jgi:hypothetical protein
MELGRIESRQRLSNPSLSLVLAASRLIAELARRPAGDFVEDESEVTLIAETDFLPDLGDASVGCREQSLCLGNT